MVRGGGDIKLLENHSSISRLVVFKPRQVLLAEQKQQKKHQPRLTMTKKQPKEQLNHETHILMDDQKLALLRSVVKYISDKGFKKTLKKFLKESQVEDDAWKANSFDLEDMYCKYLETCRNGDTNTKGLKEQEESVKETLLNDKKKKKKNAIGNKVAPIEDDGKKMKKINEANDKDAKSSISEVKKDDLMMELTNKKKKKKSKLTSESLDENGTEEDSLPAVTEKKVVLADVAEISLDHSKTEPKEKKKKKKVLVSEKLSDNGVEVFDKKQSQDTLDNGTDKSKKRKRFASDEIKDKQVEGDVTEESKRRKTEDAEESEVNAQQAEVKAINGNDVHLGGETKEGNGSVSQLKSPKPFIEQFDDSKKGNLMTNGVGKSSDKKIAKKQHNGSAEPKTVNAFQRVKVDAVEYADDRLQDNSYWAKGGADSGYGAKAQEVLGQVKGRGFRHEKTKKKRGSYRGGQIDLQSHSVKFNYSDDDE